MLADEQDDPVVGVEGDHAGREVREVDDAVDPGGSVGPRDLVVPDRDPRVLVGDASGSSGAPAIVAVGLVHAASSHADGQRRRRRSGRP